MCISYVNVYILHWGNFSWFSYFTMLSSIVIVHKSKRVVGIDDLNMGFHDVAFEGFVLNRYGIFYHITKKTMDDLGYGYLYCKLFDRVGLIIITLLVKSLHIQMHENVLQKGLYVKVENFKIKARSHNGFEKRDMQMYLIVKSTTIVSSISPLQHLNLFWFQCFSILILSNNSNLGNCGSNFGHYYYCCHYYRNKRGRE